MTAPESVRLLRPLKPVNDDQPQIKCPFFTTGNAFWDRGKTATRDGIIAAFQERWSREGVAKKFDLPADYMDRSLADQVICLINLERDAAGLPPVQRSAGALQNAAQSLVNSRVRDHSTMDARLGVPALHDKSTGEILTMVSWSAAAAVYGWMYDDYRDQRFPWGHRMNILHADARWAGISITGNSDFIAIDFAGTKYHENDTDPTSENRVPAPRAGDSTKAPAGATQSSGSPSSSGSGGQSGTSTGTGGARGGSGTATGTGTTASQTGPIAIPTSSSQSKPQPATQEPDSGRTQSQPPRLTRSYNWHNSSVPVGYVRDPASPDGYARQNNSAPAEGSVRYNDTQALASVPAGYEISPDQGGIDTNKVKRFRKKGAAAVVLVAAAAAAAFALIPGNSGGAQIVNTPTVDAGSSRSVGSTGSVPGARANTPPEVITPRTRVNTPPEVITPRTRVNTPPEVITPRTRVNTPPEVITPRTRVNTPPEVITPRTRVNTPPEVITPHTRVNTPPEVITPRTRVNTPPEVITPRTRVATPDEQEGVTARTRVPSPEEPGE